MSGITVPGELGRLKESDPVLFEALCLKECLGRLGLRGEAVRECTASVLNPKTTMFPDHTEPHALCLCLKVRAERYVNEVEVLQAVSGGKIAESGVDHTTTVEAMLAVGPLKGEKSELPARWDRAEDILRRASVDEFLALFRSSKSLASVNRLAEMLRKKGFEVRR